MAGGLNLYSGLGAKDKYRAHLGHEQLTAPVKTLRGLGYKTTTAIRLYLLWGQHIFVLY